MIFDYDIYRDELRALGCGLPLYEPGPSGYDRVRIGDVGLVTRYGFFQRIFNVFHDADHPINERFGVPDCFEPVLDSRYMEEVDLAGIAPGSRLMSEHVSSIEISTSASLQGPLVSVIEPGASARFRSSKNCAAALFLPNGATASVAVRTEWFLQYAKKHSRSWCDHARANDLDLSHEGIIFVTGHHLTDRWATAVVRGSELQTDASVGLTSPFAGTSLSVRRLQTRELEAPLRVGPSRRIDFAEDTDEVALSRNRSRTFAGVVDRIRSYGHDQCVFLRGIHAVERRIGPIRLRAAAEPRDLRYDPDSDSNSALRISSTESDADEQEFENLSDSLLRIVTNELFTISHANIYLIDEDSLHQISKQASLSSTVDDKDGGQGRASLKQCMRTEVCRLDDDVESEVGVLRVRGSAWEEEEEEEEEEVQEEGDFEMLTDNVFSLNSHNGPELEVLEVDDYQEEETDLYALTTTGANIEDSKQNCASVTKSGGSSRDTGHAIPGSSLTRSQREREHTVLSRIQQFNISARTDITKKSQSAVLSDDVSNIIQGERQYVDARDEVQIEGEDLISGNYPWVFW